MNRELYRTLLLFAATILGVYAFLLVLSPFLAAIAWALCLAAITYGPYRKVVGRFKRPRLVALGFVILTALVILVPLTFTLLLAGQELVELAGTGLTKWVSEVKDKLPGVYAWISTQLQAIGLRDVGEATERVGHAAVGIVVGPLARGALDLLGSVFTAIMGLAIMLGTQYFVYTDGARLLHEIRRLVPMDPEDTNRVFATLRNTTSAAVLGGIVVALAQGLLAGIGYAAVGVQAPIL